MRLSVFVAVVLLVGQLAGGQTTQASSGQASSGQASSGDAAVPPAWERLVSSLAAAAAAHDAQAMQALLSAGCAAHRFNADRDADLSAFIDFISANSVLGDHAYFYPPPALAADIARDVNSAAVISDSVKKTLALADKGNEAVAQQWLTQNLEPGDRTPIGVIVLWNTNPDQDQTQRPLFILIKGGNDGDGFKISQIVYGDPLG